MLAHVVLLSNNKSRLFAVVFGMPSEAACVMVVPVFNLGMTPAAIAIVGLIVPLKSNSPAPDEARPTPKCVMVPEPVATSGKSAAAVNVAAVLVTVKPLPLRATATRAYVAMFISKMMILPTIPFATQPQIGRLLLAGWPSGISEVSGCPNSTFR